MRCQILDVPEFDSQALERPREWPYFVDSEVVRIPWAWKKASRADWLWPPKLEHTLLVWLSLASACAPTPHTLRTCLQHWLPSRVFPVCSLFSRAAFQSDTLFLSYDQPRFTGSDLKRRDSFLRLSVFLGIKCRLPGSILRQIICSSRSLTDLEEGSVLLQLCWVSVW